MITTMENLSTDYKQNNFLELAKWLIQYAKFNIKTAIKNAPVGYSDSTLKLYLQLANRYFNNGKRLRYYDNLYNALDTQSKKYQPLTPSASDKKREYATKNTPYLKNSTLPIQKLDILNQPVTAKFIYGLRFNDEIKIFDKEEQARFFNKGLEYAGGTIGQLVTVELGEVC